MLRAPLKKRTSESAEWTVVAGGALCACANRGGDERVGDAALSLAYEEAANIAATISAAGMWRIRRAMRDDLAVGVMRWPEDMQKAIARAALFYRV
jgi:hypothetical protein